MFAMVLCSLAWGALIVAYHTLERERDDIKRGIVRLLDMDVAPPRSVTKLAALGGAVQLLSTLGDDLSATNLEAFSSKAEAELRRYARGTYAEGGVELRPCGPNRLAQTVVGNAALFVPAQLILAELSAQKLGGQITHAAARSAALATIPPALQDSRYEVVQAYYVTGSGISAYWSPDNMTACDHYTDDYLSLGERPYMVELRHADGELPAVRLPLYLDAGGRGLVATVCIADKLGGAFHGAICVDYRPKGMSALASGTIVRAPPLKGEVVDQTPATQLPAATLSCTADDRSCHVPLLMDSRRWLRITIEDPSQFEFWLCMFLGLAALATVLQALRHTHAWRVAEARLGMLRDLPAAVLEVERGRTGRIIAASDRAEELLGRSLPSFVDRGAEQTSVARALRRLVRLFGLVQDGPPPARFWDLFERYGFAIDVELGFSRPPVTYGLKLEEDLCECVARLRRAGLASTYFVCRRGQPREDPSSWLRVTGTPELFATTGMPMSFSLIHEPNQYALSAASLKSAFANSPATSQRAAE